jgi:hypothetical protein
MYAFNSLNATHSSASLFTRSLGTDAPDSRSTVDQALRNLIDLLARALTRHGQQDASSPLGNLLAGLLPDTGPDAIKTALAKLIRNALAEREGVSNSDTRGGLSDASSNAAGGTQADLLTQLLSGLVKILLGNLLSKQGDGANFSAQDLPILEKVAQFMDANQGVFSKPDAGSWLNELKEDSYLDADETAQVRAALDVIAQQFGKQQDATGTGDADSGSLGGLGTPLRDATNASPTSAVPAAADGTVGDSGAELGLLLGELLELGLQSTLSTAGGLGSPLNSGNSAGGATPGTDSASELGTLLGDLLERGLEVALQGQSSLSGLQQSAETAAQQIVSSLLQGNQSQALT